MNTAFEQVEKVIKSRRTVKAAAMNGKKIEQDTMQQLLALADYAPTHARTEPWRFVVYTGESLANFCKDHGQLYWDNTSEETRKEATVENLSNMGNMASHLVIAIMRRTPEAKIPKLEEYAATSAAIQNILLGAEALDISTFWSTGGMALKPAMKAYLNLQEEDEVLGLLYMGYSDQEKKEAVRNIPLEAKISWK